MLLMEGVAAQAGVALGSARRYREESRRREQALALFSMSQYLTAEHTYDDLATMLQEKSVAIFGVDYGLLFLVKENTRLVPVAIPAALSHPSHRLLIKQATLVARNACDKKTIVTDADSPDMPTQAFMAVPLIHRGTMSGVIVLVRTSGSHVTFSASVWSVLTTFANVIATTCANMTLVEQLKRHTETLEGMVTERTRQVQRSRDLLRIVLDHLPDGLVLIDSQEVILEANRVFSSTMLGCDPQAVIGQHFPSIWDELERRGELRVEVLQVPRPGPEREEAPGKAMRVFCTDVHHHQHWYEVYRIPVVGPQDEVEYYVEQWIDVTQQEALQRHLILQEQRNTLGYLTSGVVHDISPHLHHIQANLHACIEDARLPDEVQARLRSALEEATRIEHTLDSLDQFYQSPATAWECLDIKQMLLEVRQATARQFKSRQITMSLDFDNQDQRVYGQPEALRQVFLGILFNAQEAMPNGGTIRIIGRWCQDEDEYKGGNEAVNEGRGQRSHSCWHISILDTGVGMNSEQLATVFEPFTSTRSHSMGLGLYLSKRIIAQHRGRLRYPVRWDGGRLWKSICPVMSRAVGVKLVASDA
ncbi:MAG: GAF domain-containing protein [Chloroflexaceae bacterium]|nr:GAF domain-containing protein [Chloroflexaceae bacterium]